MSRQYYIFLACGAQGKGGVETAPRQLSWDMANVGLTKMHAHMDAIRDRCVSAGSRPPGWFWHNPFGCARDTKETKPPYNTVNMWFDQYIRACDDPRTRKFATNWVDERKMYLWEHPDEYNLYYLGWFHGIRTFEELKDRSDYLDAWDWRAWESTRPIFNTGQDRKYVQLGVDSSAVMPPHTEYDYHLRSMRQRGMDLFREATPNRHADYLDDPFVADYPVYRNQIDSGKYPASEVTGKRIITILGSTIKDVEARQKALADVLSRGFIPCIEANSDMDWALPMIKAV